MRLRLFLSFVLISLVSIASVAVLVRRNAVNEVHGFMFRGGMAGVDDLASALEAYYAAHRSWEGVGTVLSEQGMGHGRGMMGMMSQRLRLADAQGALVADSQGGAPGSLLGSDELGRAVPLAVGGRTVGYLLPEGGMPFNTSDEAFLAGRISRAALSAGLIAGSLSLVVALFFSYRLIRPVVELTRAAEKISKGDLTQRVPAQGTDELARLGKTFNHMAESLQRAEETRQAMTADIAHELRNPLAVQRAGLEALQDGVYPLTPDNLAPILEQNELLNRLVDDLRTLALADAGQLELQTAPTDLTALLGRVVERFAPQAARQQVELGFSDPRPSLPPVSLDPLRLEQILGNLLSNALRHTPAHGQIEIRLCTVDSKIQITVRDSGPGIPENALPLIFERFYRADKSRSRAEGGSGLGLAIARQLSQAHGGSLSAANHPEGGAIFTLTLPLLENETQ